jgi:hypothetical protein
MLRWDCHWVRWYPEGGLMEWGERFGLDLDGFGWMCSLFILMLVVGFSTLFVGNDGIVRCSSSVCRQTQLLGKAQELMNGSRASQTSSCIVVRMAHSDMQTLACVTCVSQQACVLALCLCVCVGYQWPCEARLPCSSGWCTGHCAIWHTCVLQNTAHHNQQVRCLLS